MVAQAVRVGFVEVSLLYHYSWQGSSSFDLRAGLSSLSKILDRQITGYGKLNSRDTLIGRSAATRGRSRLEQ